MRRERKIGLGLALASSAGVLVGAGFAGSAALADGGTTTTTTTPTTTTVSSVPTPAPDPAPARQHAPQPAPKHKPAARPAPKPATTPVAVTPAPSTAPAAPTPAPPAAHPKTKAVKHRRKHAPKRHAPKPAVQATTPVPPVATGPQTIRPIAHKSRSFWPPVFFFTVAVLLSLLAMAVVRARGARAAEASVPRSGWPLGGIFGRRRPREVVAEVVHTPLPPLPSRPAALSPTTLNPERRETSGPTFDPELLLRPSTSTTEASVSIEVQPYERTKSAERHDRELGDEPAGVEAAPPDDVEYATDDAPGARPPEPERCEIAVWRGYAKARFFARLATGPEESEFAVAESQPFRTRRDGTVEQTDRTEAAYRSLVESLQRKGWEREEPAEGPWYATRFVRPVAPADLDAEAPTEQLVRS